jgi:glycine dehydrogenase subunit 2
VLRRLAERARAGKAEFFHAAPRRTLLRRLDETLAARKPVLKRTPP